MGEWQVDKRSGRRYRIVGNGCREYEADFTGSFGTVPQGMVGHVQKVNITPERQESAKTCPFQRGIPCREDCALRSGNGCGIATGAQESKGRCPFYGYQCGNDCALYMSGRCVLLDR